MHYRLTPWRLTLLHGRPRLSPAETSKISYDRIPCASSKPRPMTAALKILGALYGLSGVLYLGTLWTVMTATDASTFEPPEVQKLSEVLGEEHVGQFLRNFVLAYSTVEAVAGFALLFSFWTLRAWGRYLALFYAGLWLMLHALFISPILTSAEGAGFVIIWGGMLLRAVTLVICLRQDVKALMCN